MSIPQISSSNIGQIDTMSRWGLCKEIAKKSSSFAIAQFFIGGSSQDLQSKLRTLLPGTPRPENKSLAQTGSTVTGTGNFSGSRPTPQINSGGSRVGTQSPSAAQAASAPYTPPPPPNQDPNSGVQFSSADAIADQGIKTRTIELFQILRTGNADIKKVKDLIGQGVDLGAKDNMGFSILHNVINNNGQLSIDKRKEIAQLLIDKDFDINLKNSAGETPLNAFMTMLPKYPPKPQERDGYLQFARLLLDRGAEVNTQSTYNGCTPLHYAVMEAVKSGKTDMVELLLQHGANPDLSNDYDDSHAKDPSWNLAVPWNGVHMGNYSYQDERNSRWITIQVPCSFSPYELARQEEMDEENKHNNYGGNAAKVRIFIDDFPEAQAAAQQQTSEPPPNVGQSQGQPQNAPQ
jgi:hypothetical protein